MSSMEKAKSGGMKPCCGPKSYPVAGNAGTARIKGGVMPSGGSGGKSSTPKSGK